MRILFLVFLFLTSCATLKKQICDCGGKQPKASEVKSSSGSGVPPAPHSQQDEKVNKGEAPIAVDNADIELTNRMLKAVDTFVFKNDKTEFTTLCQDKRFDCFVNEKRFPKGRKKIRRKVPPFVSGSKTGLQNNERINVRYSFYP